MGRRESDSKNDLIKKYYALNDIEQKVIQMIAIYYIDANKTELLRCAGKCKIIDKDDKILNRDKFYKILNKLYEINFIINDLYRYSNLRYKCNSSITVFLAKESLIEGHLSDYIDATREVFRANRRYSSYYNDKNFECSIRDLQADILLKNGENIRENLDYCLDNHLTDFFKLTIFNELLNEPFRADLFDGLGFEDRISLLRIVITVVLNNTNNIESLEPLKEYYINQFEKTKHNKDRRLYYFNSISELFSIMLFSENLERFIALFLKNDDFDDIKYRFLGVFHYLNGENEKAIAEFNLALKTFRREKKKKKILFNDITDTFYILANINSDSIAFHKTLEEIYLYEERHPTNSYHRINSLYAHILALENKQDKGRVYLSEPIDIFSHYITELVKSMNYKKLLDNKIIEQCRYKAKKIGFEWLAVQFYSISNQFKIKNDKKTEIKYIKDMFSKKESWERILNHLNGIDTFLEKEKTQGSRLIWILSVDEIFDGNKYKISDIKPRVQKLGKNNKWSQGRAVSLKKLYHKELDCLTLKDIELCNCIELYKGYYYYGEEYRFDINTALPRLINHPHIYIEDIKTHIELIKKEPELSIKSGKDGSYTLFLNISGTDSKTIYEESKNRYFMYEIKFTHKKIYEIIGKKVRIPKDGKTLLIKTISKISPYITINTELENYYEGVENVESDSRIRVQLKPDDDGLRMQLFVRPFLGRGGYYIPGEGQKRIIKKFEDKTYQTERNLIKEKENVYFILEACSQLSLDDNTSEPFYFHDIEQSLQLMSDLQEIKDTIIIEWPEGEKFKLSSKASFVNLRLSLKSQNEWFSLSGSLEIDNKKVIAFEELLEKIENSESRFIELDNNQFISLSKKLYTKLNEISAITFKKENVVQFKLPAALSISNIIDEVKKIKTDKEWKKIAERIKNAENVEIVLPSTLKADFREYQLDGYKWMMQLSQMGFGACLADDMGLGKTVQALAIILQRATLGPSLVIAPASVVHNWKKEIRRFTPTLNSVELLNENRKNIINNLKSFDILITTYGLLGRESELLADKDWATIVLDEGQFIKNMSSKRSKSAMKLKGAFKIITTGTPIENHPLEMWNLFNFINPGLFGNAEFFNKRFTIPIVKDNNKEAKNKLRKIITPFILRRKKRDVLEELPAKTEITLYAEPDKDEVAFYEALRRQSIKSIEDNNDGNGHVGQNHLKVLAELTKLRLASCHPSLIGPNVKLAGAKVNLFLEIIDELVENKHKVLIFSQFVKFLKIIEKEIQKKGIQYQYLDGSTPLKKRERSINDFQSGKGDAFLISLKAGGLGLNLTAANYVIHLDPWWNPAVEDQASDRAHRIGQKQPVTIYRIVTKGTIEEKVLSLHKKKRELADALLEGSEISGKLSYEQLIDLIKNR